MTHVIRSKAQPSPNRTEKAATSTSQTGLMALYSSRQTTRFVRANRSNKAAHPFDRVSTRGKSRQVYIGYLWSEPKSHSSSDIERLRATSNLCRVCTRQGFPRSIRTMVWIETPDLCARSARLISISSRFRRKLLFFSRIAITILLSNHTFAMYVVGEFKLCQNFRASRKFDKAQRAHRNGHTVAQETPEHPGLCHRWSQATRLPLSANFHRASFEWREAKNHGLASSLEEVLTRRM